MADYKVAIQLSQYQVGEENSKVKITINGVVVAEEVEVTSVDERFPNMFVYDITNGTAPGPDSWHTIRVDFLNDLWLDVDNDRNVCICRIGYMYKNADGNYENEQVGRIDPADPRAGADGSFEFYPAGNIDKFGYMRMYNCGQGTMADGSTRLQKWKYTLTELNETNGVTPGEVQTGFYKQHVTATFAEIEMAFEFAKTWPDDIPNYVSVEELADMDG